MVKTWLPENAMHEGPTFMDQVLFERALILVSELELVADFSLSPIVSECSSERDIGSSIMGMRRYVS